MRVNSENRDNKDYILLLEEKLDAKVKEISQLEYEILESHERVMELDVEKQEMSWKCSQYPEQLKKINELERTLGSYQREFNIPQSLEDVLSLSQIIWPDKLEIHELAMRSACSYAHRTDSKIIQEGWLMLNKLSTVMYNLKFIESSADLQSTFTSLTGIDFSMTESKQTKKNKAFTSIRKCTRNGVEYEFFPHLKGNIRSDFRVHFAFIEEERKILICHFCEHLDNAKTQYI